MFEAISQNALVKKVLNFITFQEDDEQEQGYQPEAPQSQHTAAPRKTGKVLPFTNSNPMAVAVNDPKSMEDAREVADNLRSNMVVLMNISKMEKDMAKEILFFLSGVVYALNGDSKKIGDGVFLFTPHGIPIRDFEAVQAEAKPAQKSSLFIEEL